MRKGLRLSKDNILDPKFYYHLGQGLALLGRDEEAYDTYSQAADLGVFLSAEQRSLYNIDGLTARPWWSVDQTGYGRYLKVELKYDFKKSYDLSLSEKSCIDSNLFGAYYLNHNYIELIDRM